MQPFRNTSRACFNTQPPEGGWNRPDRAVVLIPVSTHSRLKAAGNMMLQLGMSDSVSTHSRLKAAGNFPKFKKKGSKVSTHSRLKAAGFRSLYL